MQSLNNVKHKQSRSRSGSNIAHILISSSNTAYQAQREVRNKCPNMRNTTVSSWVYSCFILIGWAFTVKDASDARFLQSGSVSKTTRPRFGGFISAFRVSWLRKPLWRTKCGLGRQLTGVWDTANVARAYERVIHAMILSETFEILHFWTERTE